MGKRREERVRMWRWRGVRRGKGSDSRNGVQWRGVGRKEKIVKGEDRRGG
jgi:hypothetical protein